MIEGNILLIEDNPDDVELTLRAFRQHDLRNRIVVARDGAEAIAMATRGPDGGRVPGLILLDLKLPKVSGLEVLKALRDDERTALVPIVVLTSSVEEEDLVSAYRLGANSYLRKPVDFDEFLGVVGQLGLYWLILNQQPPGPPASGSS
jgi:two-component system, response regulator